MSTTEPEVPATEPEPVPEVPDESTETPDEGEGDDESAPSEPPDGDLAGREAKARREARNLRQQLKEARAGHDQAITDAVATAKAESAEQIADLESQLLEARAELHAVGKFKNPKDVTHFIDVHDIPLDKLDEAIAKLLRERPYLAAVDNNNVPQGPQNGHQPTNGGANDWLREQLQRGANR